MKNSTLHIKKPSDKLLNLVRELQYNKQAHQEDMKANWNKYFPKEK